MTDYIEIDASASAVAHGAHEKKALPQRAVFAAVVAAACLGLTGVAAYWAAIDEDRTGHVTMGEFCRRAPLVA